MHTDDPKPPSDEAHELEPMSPRGSFDIRELESMAEEEADAEWLRHPEAWHMH